MTRIAPCSKSGSWAGSLPTADYTDMPTSTKIMSSTSVFLSYPVYKKTGTERVRQTDGRTRSH